MSYSRSTYNLVQARLEKRRRESEEEQMLHRERAFAAIPELISIQASIARCGAEVVGALAKGADSTEYIKQLAARSLDAQRRRRELLQAAGFPTDYLEPHFVCNICSDTGSTDDGMCPCQRQMLLDAALDEIERFAPIRRSTFDSFSVEYYPDTPNASGVSPKNHMEQIEAFCKAYAMDFSAKSQSLFMHGATGLGKTHLSLAIAEQAIRRGAGVIYGSAPNIFSSLERERFNRQTQNDRYSEQELLESDLVIIDDLGAEFSTQFTVSCVYNIVNTRLLSGKPTIISTNLTPHELEEKYTQRITSRIIGSYVSLMFVGKDIRQLKSL